MGNYREQMWETAGEKVLEIIADDDSWNLFVQQARLHGTDLNDYKNIRERVRIDEAYKGLLQSLYINCSATQICDTCDYNFNKRRGQRRFAERERFDCNLEEQEGEEYQDKTKAPSWLDVERNLCSKYYAHW